MTGDSPMNEPRLSLMDTAELLKSGGVVIMGTDTLPGFHCLCDDVSGLGRIAAAKGRSPDKPLLVLAADLEMARLVTGELSPEQLEYCRRCWPGPFSLVLPAADHLPPELLAGGSTVAVRVPRHQALVDLLRLVGEPLASTSVNLEGEEPARDMDQAAAFARSVDGIIELGPAGGTGTGGAVSSAVVDVTCWPPRVLRSGPETPPNVIS
jgi:L-threonylcarbamoyladenylate synthase